MAHDEPRTTDSWASGIAAESAKIETNRQRRARIQAKLTELRDALKPALSENPIVARLQPILGLESLGIGLPPTGGIRIQFMESTSIPSYFAVHIWEGIGEADKFHHPTDAEGALNAIRPAIIRWAATYGVAR